MDIKDLESVGMDPNRSAPFSLEPELSPFKDLQEIGDPWKNQWEIRNKWEISEK